MVESDSCTAVLLNNLKLILLQISCIHLLCTERVWSFCMTNDCEVAVISLSKLCLGS